jgi:hypothetical protein
MSDSEDQTGSKKKAKGAPRKALAATKNRSARPYKRLDAVILSKRKNDMSKRVGILRAKLCILEDRLEKLTEEETVRSAPMPAE